MNFQLNLESCTYGLRYHKDFASDIRYFVALKIPLSLGNNSYVDFMDPTDLGGRPLRYSKPHNISCQAQNAR